MPRKYDVGFMARAVRLVRDHADDFGSVTAVSLAVGAQLGATQERLRRWVGQAEVDAGARPEVNTAELAEIRRLKAESKRLTEVNAILRRARLRPSCHRNAATTRRDFLT